MELTIAQERQGDWTVLVVHGELDLYSQPLLREQVHGIDGDAPKVALDLSGVGFVDSSGLGAIVGSLQDVRARGGELTLIAPDGAPLARMLALTGLDGMLRPLPDRTALGAS
ncbi:MAG TPA: STAS domain-containing protein [Actinomycetota bacterium]